LRRRRRRRLRLRLPLQADVVLEEQVSMLRNVFQIGF
jgi:hypothetical protein